MAGHARAHGDSGDRALRSHGIDLRHLAALRAIAEHRSFGRAAAALHVTQSAVSHQIAQLEERLGETLVDRRARGGPDLTAAGAIVARHAGGVFDHLAAATAELDALADGATVLRVGVYPSAGAAIYPRLVRLLRARAPGLLMQLHEGADDAELLQLLGAGHLDVTFVVLPVTGPGFATRQLVEDPWRVIVSAESPLAGAGSISLRELARLPLIGLRHGSALQLGESRLLLAGEAVDVVLRADDVGTIQGLVAAGLGAAILPRMLLTVRHPGIAQLAVSDAVEPRRIGIAWRADAGEAGHVRLAVEAAADAARAAAAPDERGDAG